MNNVQQPLNTLRNAFTALIILVALLALFFNMFADSPPPPSGSISISEVVADAQQGKIAQIEIQRDDPQDIFVTYNNQLRPRFSARVPANESIMSLLLAAGVPLDTIDIHVAPPPVWGGTIQTTLILLPPLLMVGLFIFLRRVRLAQQQQSVRQSDQQS